MSKTLKEIQKDAKAIVDEFKFNWSAYVQYIHLVEEVAELGEAITVNQGDRKRGSGEEALADHGDIVEEIGDSLFSLIAVANKLNVDCSVALDKALLRYKRKLEKLNSNSQDSL